VVLRARAQHRLPDGVSAERSGWRRWALSQRRLPTLAFCTICVEPCRARTRAERPIENRPRPVPQIVSAPENARQHIPAAMTAARVARGFCPGGVGEFGCGANRFCRRWRCGMWRTLRNRPGRARDRDGASLQERPQPLSIAPEVRHLAPLVEHGRPGFAHGDSWRSSATDQHKPKDCRCRTSPEQSPPEQSELCRAKHNVLTAKSSAPMMVCFAQQRGARNAESMILARATSPPGDHDVVGRRGRRDGRCRAVRPAT